MSELKIWAPSARKVEVELKGSREVMHADADGWWSLRSYDLVHEADYALWLDGAGPFPDPRSSWQPAGVHGFSRWFDHSRFAWDDSNWQPTPLPEAIIYELHTGTFTPEGTFEAVITKLDELEALGITHIEIMPVAEFSGARGWGYDGVDLYAPHHVYGGPIGLKRLVNACHQRNMGVILDVVYNHLGPEGNYIEKYAPYFKTDAATPWGSAVNLDGAGSEHVRRFFIDNALMWLRDYHFDGLRLDATHSFVDSSPTHFLAQLTTEVKTLGFALGRNFFLIAENDLNDPGVVRPVREGGLGFDAQGNEDFHHALHTLLTGEDHGYLVDYGKVADLAGVLTENFCLYERYSKHRGKTHGSSAKGVDSSRFVAFIQNHDQTGNRAHGQRIGHLANPGQIKLGAAVTLLAPFIPMLFQGEEWAASSPFTYFADLADPVTREALRNGRRQEFAFFHQDAENVPDPLAETTWRQSQLNWDERTQKDHREMLDWYKALIELRTLEPDFAPGTFDCGGVTHDEACGLLSFRRGRFRVVCNFSANPQIAGCSAADFLDPVLVSEDAVHVLETGEISMPPHSVAILENVADKNASTQGG